MMYLEKSRMPLRKQFQEEVFVHQSLIHKICVMYRNTQEEREDLFQDIVFQLWKSYPSFERKSKITTWMYKIALNTAIATFRKRKLETINIKEDMLTYEGQASSADIRRDKLVWAIKQMNDADRALIALYLDDLSYLEIGEILGLTVSNVGVRINRIKEKLRKILKSEK